MEYTCGNNDYDDYNAGCNSNNACLPLSQCDLNSLNSEDFPPTYCADSSQTEQDHICCAKNCKILMPDHVAGDVPHVPQPPLFTKANGESLWPCVDHTEMCQTWVKNHPDSCNPGNDHYEFMKLACMESCQVCKDHVSTTIYKKLFHFSEFKKTCFYKRVV